MEWLLEPLPDLGLLALLGWGVRWKVRRVRWRIGLTYRQEGVIVQVRRLWQTTEAGRVGFNREKSKNPEVEFDEQLATVVARARSRATTLNATQRNVLGR